MRRKNQTPEPDFVCCPDCGTEVKSFDRTVLKEVPEHGRLPEGYKNV